MRIKGQDMVRASTSGSDSDGTVVLKSDSVNELGFDQGRNWSSAWTEEKKHKTMIKKA